MLEYSSVLNVGVKKGIINGFWSVSSVSEKKWLCYSIPGSNAYVHITPLVINSLKGGHTHTYTQIHTHTHTDIHTETILRNQAHAWLKIWKDHI